jgi:hypothetical protein
MFKTLIIHPADPTTDFCKQMYSGLEQVDKITYDEVNPSQLEEYDKIIMIGHGTSFGLFTSDQTGYVIDHRHVEILQKKTCVFIWCNANIFVITLDSGTIIWIIYLYIGFLLTLVFHSMNKTLEKQDRVTILAYPTIVYGWIPYLIIFIIEISLTKIKKLV